MEENMQQPPSNYLFVIAFNLLLFVGDCVQPAIDWNRKLDDTKTNPGDRSVFEDIDVGQDIEANDTERGSASEWVHMWSSTN